MPTQAPRPKQILLGVGGGIAAYKGCELLRRLRSADFAAASAGIQSTPAVGAGEAGDAVDAVEADYAAAEVRVIPTASALRFVGEPTWAALSGKPVTADPFDDVHEVPHVRLGQQADLLVVAPATANLLAKTVNGLADDLLTNTLLTARCPIVMAPAMHTEMWEHPATVANVEILRSRGVIVLDPDSGRLTGADSGPGRLSDPAAIAEVCAAVLARGDVPAEDRWDLAGRRIVVTAGGTREALDPVRFLGNRSSGRMGWALAAAAASRGAQVSVVAANVAAPDPAGAEVTRVESAAQMAEATSAAAVGADAVIMAAAVADFRPAHQAESKIKKHGISADGAAADPIELVQNQDILAGLVANRQPGAVLVGFAAETGDARADVLQLGREKLARKGCDLLVVNDVSAGRVFGADHTRVWILDQDADGSAPSVAEPESGSKAAVAHLILDAVRSRLA